MSPLNIFVFFSLTILIMHYPTIPCLTNIFIVTCTATVIPVIIMFFSIFSDNPDPGTNCMVDQDSSRKQKMVFQLRTIPIHLLLHHLFLQATIVNENIYIASFIFVMDLNDNEYKKKWNISKRQSKVLNRRTNKTLTKVKGQQTAN